MLRPFTLLFILCTAAFGVEKSGTITADETWSGAVSVVGELDVRRCTIVIAPGTQVTFSPKSKITINPGGELRSEGTLESPIHFIGRGYIGINGGRGSFAHCRLSKVGVGSWYPQAEAPILRMEDCIIVGGQLSCYVQGVVISRCYIAAVDSKYAVVELPPGSVVSDNIFDGGSWVTKSIGGTIIGNVFISQVIPEGGTTNDHTHEHVCGIHAEAIIERNIFVGRSFAALMSIGAHNGSGALIRNNTIDQRAGKGAGYMFHLTTPKPQGIELRNNLFMRCRGIVDEEKTPDAIAATDFNAYVAVSRRYEGVVISGKDAGDEGFGKHSIDLDDPAAVCVDPEIGYPFPYAGDAMLSGQVTVLDALKLYRDAYTPIAGSPLIDAGSPADAASVSDGHCDIGAVEFVE